MALNAAREFAYGIRLDNSNLQADAAQARQTIQGVGQSVEGVGKSAASAATPMQSLMQGFDGLLRLGAGGWAGSQLAGMFLNMNRSLVDAQVNADRLMLQLGASAGAANAGRELEYVRNVTNRLGLELNTTATSYARFAAAARGTSLEGTGVRKVFESVSGAAAVMGLTTEETQGALRALEQMMSKGVVQAEELRGQLGDRLPGALQIAARSMGVTTQELQKMVQNGEVLANDFLPKFASQLDKELGGSVDAAGDRMAASVNRISGAWETLKGDVAKTGVGDFLRGQLEIAADGLTNVSEHMRAARESGAGFFGQIAAGTIAVGQFLNPLQALGYDSLSAANKLKEARDNLEMLQGQMQTNPGNIFLRESIRDATELVRTLEAAAHAKINLRAIDNTMMARTEKEAEEAATQRKAALAKVTDTLTKKNTELASSLRVLADSRAKGDIGEAEFLNLVDLAKQKYLPKGPSGRGARTPKAEKSAIMGPSDELFQQEAQRMQRESQRVEQFMLGKVFASDQREQERQARVLEQAQHLSGELLQGAERLDAEMLVSAEARAQALLAIEKAQITSRIDALVAEGADRQRLTEAAGQYLLARERQLTEELKPEWQRRLEAWANTTLLMRTAYDDMMSGFLTQGEQTFTEWARSGKVNTKALVNYIGDEFAKLAYRKYIAGPLSEGFGSLLNLVGLSGAGSSSFAGAAAGGGYTGFEFGPGRATGGGTRAGALHPINEGQEPEVFTASNGRSWLLSGGQGWVSTLGASQGGARGATGGAGQVIQHINYNVPPGQSPAAYAAALQANNARLKAEILADASRPGRPMQRAVALGQM